MAKRRRGHPRVEPDGQAAQVRIRMRTRTYDGYYDLAKERGLSIPAVLRWALDEQLDAERRKIQRSIS